jgi:hypothetical protein
VTTSEKFPSTRELSERARRALRQPLVIEGKTFVSTSQAAQLCGLSTTYLLLLARRAGPGVGTVLTAPSGLRFIRKPRHQGDQRCPTFFAVESLP